MKTLKKLFFLFSIFFSLFTAHAQSPQKMSYQAVIRNASNALITDQAIGLRVSILQGSATGTEVYKEIFNPNPQTNVNGLVTVEIGTGTPLTGTFSGIDWANGPYFIKTETDPTGGTNYTITGTSQLISVPYALYAENSGNAGWGLLGNSGTNANTNFIGTTDNQDLVFKRNNIKAGRIGSNSTSFGSGALNSQTTGINNTANGVDALYSNTTGNFNTATGYKALRANTTGFDNTANGYTALYSNTTGESNTANGTAALYFNTTGGYNTATGLGALIFNTTGDNNTANGYKSLYFNSSGVSNTANGYTALYSNTTGNYNTANGQSALYYNTTGDNNTGDGYRALSNLTTGNNNIGIGYDAQVPSATGSNQVRIGNGAITYAGINVAWSITSDRRHKEQIQTSGLGLDFIKALHPVSYTRKNSKDKKTEYGFIAQELETVLKEFGAANNGTITIDDEGFYSVRYNDLLAPMVKAIQEQNQLIETQQKLIETLTQRIDALESKN
jgi:hypothetical protein